MSGRPGPAFVDFSDVALEVRQQTAEEALRGLATVTILTGRVLQVLGYPEARIEELMHETVRMNLHGPVFGRPVEGDVGPSVQKAIAEGDRS